ncbi:MAG TPA: shikimate kinase [Bacteroidales bacterium]|nr:shikimate kinase [Bacteroidales bacterium]
MRIFLIGFMASGKSTIGKKLANKLNLPFVDLDSYIEEKFNTTIRILMYEKGENEFREIEKEALVEVVNKFNKAVISTGGGTPCYFDNMQTMQNNGITIYIEVDVQTLVHRLMYAKKDRPLIWGKSKEDLTVYAEELLSKRKSYYKQAKYKVNGMNLNVNTLVGLIK